MQFQRATFIAGLTAAAVLSDSALAATIALATTPRNIRSGPGPQYSIVGAILNRGQATVLGCIRGSLWYQVSFNGQHGSVYSQYLVATLSGRSLAVAQTINTMPPVTQKAPVETVGTAVRARAITGTPIAPPVGQSLSLNPPP